MDGSPILKYPWQSVSAQAICDALRQIVDSRCVTREQIRDLLAVAIVQLQTHSDDPYPLIHTCEVLEIIRLLLTKFAEYINEAFESVDAVRTEVVEILESLDGVLETLQHANTHLHVRAKSACLRATVAAVSNSKDTSILRRFKAALELWDCATAAEKCDQVLVPLHLQDVASSSSQTTLEEYLAMPDSDYSVALKYLKQAAGRASIDVHAFMQSHIPEHASLFNATFSNCTSYTRLEKDALFAKLLDRLRIKCSASTCSSDIMSPDTKLKLCSQCRSTRYCSSACQQYSWKHELHSTFCRPYKVHEVGDIVQIDSGIHEVRIVVDATSVVLCLLGDTVRHVVVDNDSEMARLVSVQEREWVIKTALDEWIRCATHLDVDELDRIRKETRGLDAEQADEYYRRNMMDALESV
ncbi:hypothetical protein BJ741DRAFT_631517 [Chytriomyces cf. hyalinus JEL632]|nr:hypothetical protein BJ741DRAFT_631517 [Chytriomyces cf. hyalinus JEL632]